MQLRCQKDAQIVEIGLNYHSVYKMKHICTINKECLVFKKKIDNFCITHISL